LFIHGDGSAREISRAIGLKLDTVYEALKRLNQFIEKKPTGKKNQVKYHLPEGNYSKAMRRYGWPKERLPVLKLQRRAQEIHKWAASMDDYLSFLSSPEVQRLLNADAKRDLFLIMRDIRLTDRVSLVDRLREGTVCIECLNNCKGFQGCHFDAEAHVYICEKCGVEQKPEPFSAAIASEDPNKTGGRLRSPLPSTVRAQMILE
jgi:hypothetical protein